MDLRDRIHSDFSNDTGVWAAYWDELQSACVNQSKCFDHALREFNKKVSRLNLPQSFLFAPYDAGLRYSPNVLAPEGHAFLYSPDRELYLSPDEEPYWVLI